MFPSCLITVEIEEANYGQFLVFTKKIESIPLVYALMPHQRTQDYETVLNAINVRPLLPNNEHRVVASEFFL